MDITFEVVSDIRRPSKDLRSPGCPDQGMDTNSSVLILPHLQHHPRNPPGPLRLGGI